MDISTDDRSLQTFTSQQSFQDTGTPRPVGGEFLVNGIASGDVTQDSVVLWARSTFLGEVSFEYSKDVEFSTIAGNTTATVTEPEVPVKVLVEDLDPGTEYFFRVTDAAGSSESGRFLTASELGKRNGLTFGISGDWQQAPPYPILNSAAESNLDLFIKLGDTIYADLETPALPGVSQARTLEDFRTKHSEILSPRFGLSATSDLQATTSILATIDDHELVDNFAGGAAPGESPDAPDIGSSPEPLFTDDVDFVNDTQAYENALQAYQEYQPLLDEFYDTPSDPRTDGERKLYRANDYGSDASIFVLDSRSFRDAPLPPADLSKPVPFLAQAFNPNRTLLGRAQVDLLKADLLEAHLNGTTWKFVVIPEPIQNFGVINAEDRFEGYAAERTEILKFIDENDIDNVVFMAGDFHGTIVNNLTYQVAAGQEQIATNAFEVVTGPVAFFNGRFGPNVANITFAAGLISEAEFDFYNSLPVAPDGDDIPNDKDDFIKQLLVSQTNLFGYDPVGLNKNLASADGLIDANLLQGDYLASHNFSWSEFDIEPETQKLTVTTYGIDAYSEENVLNDPSAIISQEPQIISQFEVLPQESLLNEIVGTNGDDRLRGTLEDDRILGLRGDDTLTGLEGNDFLDPGRGNNIVNAGDGDDLIIGSGKAEVENRIDGGKGTDTAKYDGDFASFSVTRFRDSIVQVGTNSDILTNVEQLEFSDQTIAVEDLDVLLNDPLTRFRNKNIPTGTYLFTGDEEAENVRQNFSDVFEEEGFAFNVSLEANDHLVLFNRFRNNQIPGTYIFANEEESASILENFSEAFTLEGVAFYTLGADAGIGVDIFRFRNTEIPGSYIFVGEAERQNILANFPQFIEEGIAFEAVV